MTGDARQSSDAHGVRPSLRRAVTFGLVALVSLSAPESDGMLIQLDADLVRPFGVEAETASVPGQVTVP